MSLRKLPEIRADARFDCLQFDLRTDAVERWKPEVRAASDGDDATISIYGPIGATWDGEGVTVKRIAAALRSIGNKSVTVNVNSPGGDFFEGVAIYNALREHRAQVTINVMGLAASAASVIAMAGDEILMGEGSFLMIHNAWGVAIGNRHDMAEAAAFLEPFDAEMAALYASRTGMKAADVVKLMDAETWIGSARAVQDGFADGMLDRDFATTEANASGERKALALVEAAMAKSGYSRSQRRDTLKSLFSGKPSAAEPAMPSAGNADAALISGLISTINSR